MARGRNLLYFFAPLCYFSSVLLFSLNLLCNWKSWCRLMCAIGSIKLWDILSCGRTGKATAWGPAAPQGISSTVPPLWPTSPSFRSVVLCDFLKSSCLEIMEGRGWTKQSVVFSAGHPSEGLRGMPWITGVCSFCMEHCKAKACIWSRYMGGGVQIFTKKWM